MLKKHLFANPSVMTTLSITSSVTSSVSPRQDSTLDQQGQPSVEDGSQQEAQPSSGDDGSQQEAQPSGGDGSQQEDLQSPSLPATLQAVKTAAEALTSFLQEVKKETLENLRLQNTLLKIQFENERNKSK